MSLTTADTHSAQHEYTIATVADTMDTMIDKHFSLPLGEAEREPGADGKLIAYIFIQKNAAVPSVV